MNLDGGNIFSLVIEHIDEFEKFYVHTHRSLNNQEEAFGLFENGESLDFGKSTDVVYSPLELHYDKKDIKRQIFKILELDISQKAYDVALSNLMSGLIELAEKMSDSFGYELEYENTLSVRDFFKVLDIRLKNPEGNFLEKLTEYITVIQRLTGKRLFILFSCLQFMDEKSITLLEKQVKYLGVKLLFCDSRQYDLEYSGGEYIIDSDLCEIC